MLKIGKQSYHVQKHQKSVGEISKGIQVCTKNVFRDLRLVRNLQNRFMNFRERFLREQHYYDKNKLWIYKPSGSSRGRGIFVFSQSQKVKKKDNYIISEYLSKPHLLNGFKYDLRLYVVVVSLDPLRVYLHKEGLVRICTHKYSTKYISLKFPYLTPLQ